jgi:hypothetical protein
VSITKEAIGSMSAARTEGVVFEFQVRKEGIIFKSMVRKEGLLCKNAARKEGIAEGVWLERKDSFVRVWQ